MSGLTAVATNKDITDKEWQISQNMSNSVVENNALMLIPVAYALLEATDKALTAYDAYELAKAVEAEDETKVKEITTSLAIGLATEGIPGNKIIQKISKTLKDSKIGKGIDDVVEGVEDNTYIWSNTKYNTPVQNAYKHFKKHGKDFPEFQNAKQYVEGTKNFINNPPSGTMIKTDSAGYKYFYNEKTNTFAVAKPDGTPMTMYNQHQNHR